MVVLLGCFGTLEQKISGILATAADLRISTLQTGFRSPRIRKLRIPRAYIML